MPTYTGGYQQRTYNSYGQMDFGQNPLNGADTFAKMTRDMWAQWVQQFMPIENTLIDYASDVTLPGQAANKAIAGVQSAYAQGAKMSDLSMKTSGIQLNDQERTAIARDRSLSQSLAEVQAANTARTLTTDRQRSTLGVPVNTGDLALRGGR